MIHTICGKPSGERCEGCAYEECSEWNYHNEDAYVQLLQESYNDLLTITGFVEKQ